MWGDKNKKNRSFKKEYWIEGMKYSPHKYWSTRLKDGSRKAKLTLKSINSGMKTPVGSIGKELGAGHVSICEGWEWAVRQSIIYRQYQGEQ